MKITENKEIRDMLEQAIKQIRLISIVINCSMLVLLSGCGGCGDEYDYGAGVGRGGHRGNSSSGSSQLSPVPQTTVEPEKTHLSGGNPNSNNDNGPIVIQLENNSTSIDGKKIPLDCVAEEIIKRYQNMNGNKNILVLIDGHTDAKTLYFVRNDLDKNGLKHEIKEK